MVAPRRDMPDDFAGYRFIHPLGSGGLSTVYLIENTASNSRAVMKVGNPDLDDAAQERFRSEAAALGRLQSKNIPSLMDVGALPDGRPFLVTEWVEGSDLETLLSRKTALSLRDVLVLTRAIANALACAHAQNMVHRDVKPANILVPESGGRPSFEDAKLLDFGVLGTLLADTHKTSAGMLVGTAMYMSPAQVRAEALTPEADIFSLGVVTYEMLSGHLPFEGENIQEMFYALLSRDPKPLPDSLPFSVVNLVLRCLNKEPAGRPHSGAAMLASVDALLNTLGRSLEMPVPPPQMEAPVAFAAPPAQYTPMFAQPAMSLVMPEASAPVTAQAPRRGNRMIVMAVVAVVLAALSAFVILIEQPRPKPAPPIGEPSPPIGEPSSIGESSPVFHGWTDVALITAGAMLVAGGLLMGMAVRRLSARKRDQINGQISDLLKGGRTRKALSMTLAVQMDQVIAKCKLMDEKFLGLTMALMVKEYDSARKFDDRQKALMNAVAILDKLGPKLSPWYVRHDKLVATGVSLVGILSGLAAVAQSVAKLIKGAP